MLLENWSEVHECAWMCGTLGKLQSYCRGVTRLQSCAVMCYICLNRCESEMVEGSVCIAERALS